MYQLKAGDRVRLTGDLELIQDDEALPQGTKGQILSVDERGYTVEFEGEINPVTALSDYEIELDEE